MRSTLSSLAASTAALVAVHTLVTPLPSWLWIAFGAVAAGRVVMATQVPDA